MSERKVQIMMESDLGDITDQLCGLPQGSPASLILFLLCTAPIHESCRDLDITRFGYADDCAILVKGDDLVETSAKAQS
jgi:hypothetical protein